MSKEELELIWYQIKSEARSLSDCEPVLASFYHNTVLNHINLASALNYILTNKLANFSIPSLEIYNLIEETYIQNPSIIESAAYDIQAVYKRDPVVEQYSVPLLYFKGFHALQFYRIGNCLWKKGRNSLAIYLQNLVSTFLAIDIHPASQIGHGVMLDHATGIVIGETSIVENNVSILQSVTLGGTGKVGGNRHPKICQGAMIGAGAKILGNIEIGCGAKIGAGSVVLHSIPAYATAAGIPARIIPNCMEN
ncbi:serine acetyltransferase [Candidatus Ishikawaella capsulata Mpkobe]|uniref:Serine acetyltransferase n=1 Tax=Candidatus Ishikawaella capsulata Mpkobe TaxID=476281 RepID=C5WDR8_9ENTR|nr:serine acetyltransferase [Candidatus Ishikawaella capsulata Mpkobe]